VTDDFLPDPQVRRWLDGVEPAWAAWSTNCDATIECISAPF
jgi:hypothetical protein